jgi:hypothetical protein
MADRGEDAFGDLNHRMQPEVYEQWNNLEAAEVFRQTHRYSRTHVFISCWHAQRSSRRGVV